MRSVLVGRFCPNKKISNFQVFGGLGPNSPFLGVWQKLIIPLWSPSFWILTILLLATCHISHVIVEYLMGRHSHIIIGRQD